MKKLFFIAWFIVCITVTTDLLPSQPDNSVEKLVHIMVSGANTKDLPSSSLMKKRNPNDYQDVYELVIKNPTLLNGIIHDGRTFALLCIKRGYPDLLERLIIEGHPVDLATPCNLIGPHEPQTTVLHELFGENWKVSGFCKSSYPEEYSALIKRLTKLIINKYPQLLDMPIYRCRTARQQAQFWNVGYLVSRDVPQSINDNSVCTNTITSSLESELLTACKAWDIAAVQELIKKPGIDVNQADNNGETPLLAACKKKNLHIVETLLAVPEIDVNQADNDGKTPLLVACKNIDLHIVTTLVTMPKIDVNQADNDGETPLLVACKRKPWDFTIIDMLLKNGAVNKANNKGETPLGITKDTLLFGTLEFYLVGEIHASRYCTGLSAAECKYAHQHSNYSKV